ncbi:hypothetical protein [Desulfofundulus thermobenzoicus]|nr:hypothetical protein [Desulfofundulus thermobenzoicus]
MFEGSNDYLLALYCTHPYLFALLTILLSTAVGIALETLTIFPARKEGQE